MIRHVAVTDAPYARARGSMTKAQEAVEPPTVRRIVTIGGRATRGALHATRHLIRAFGGEGRSARTT
jgi:hypothetical protein